MYSYEDRIRAVELYIQLGKRVRATILQLGYPTKNALIGWYRAYSQDCDLRKGYLRSVQKYTDDHKQAAVQHFLDHDRCIAAYVGRAMDYYRFRHVERGMGMIFKSIGLEPRGRLSDLAAKGAWRLLQWRRERYRQALLKAANENAASSARAAA